MLISRFVAGICSIVLLFSGASVVCGQDYPNKTIRMIGGAAGGGSDFAARLIAQGISGPLGQQVIKDAGIKINLARKNTWPVVNRPRPVRQ